MTSLKDRLAVYVAHLLGRKNASTDDYEDAQALLALFQQEAMAIIDSMPERGFGMPHNDKDFQEGRFTKYIEAEELKSRLKERLELAPTSKEAEDE